VLGADDGEDVAEAGVAGGAHQVAEQQSPEAAATPVVAQIDRVLDRMAERRTGMEGGQRGPAGDAATGLRSDHGDMAAGMAAEPGQAVGQRLRLLLEGAGAGAHVVVVDRADGPGIGRRGGSDGRSGGHAGDDGAGGASASAARRYGLAAGLGRR